MAATIFTAHVVDSYESQEIAVYKGWYIESYAPGYPITFVRACMCGSEIQFEIGNDNPSEPLSYDELKDDLFFSLNMLLTHVGCSSCQVGAINLYSV